MIDRRAALFLVTLLVIAILVPILNLLVPETSGMHLPDGNVILFGKYTCYALLAVALD